MHAQTRLTGQPTDGGGVLEVGVFFLFRSGGFTGLLGQLSTDTLLLGGGLLVFFFAGSADVGWLAWAEGCAADGSCALAECAVNSDTKTNNATTGSGRRNPAIFRRQPTGQPLNGG